MAESLRPLINDLSAPFWTAAGNGVLVLPYCVRSGRPFWPPSPASPFVTAGEVEWRAVATEGVVRSLVVYRRAFQKVLEPNLPYGIALVELEWGVRLQAHVADPAALAPGNKARLSFAPLAADAPPVLHAARADG